MIPALRTSIQFFVVEVVRISVNARIRETSYKGIMHRLAGGILSDDYADAAGSIAKFIDDPIDQSILGSWSERVEERHPYESG